MLLFLPGVVIITIAVRETMGPRPAQICVLLASLLFYAWWKPVNLSYLFASISINWLFAGGISRAEQPRRARLLQLGLIFNIGFLCIFKYMNFVLKSLPLLAQSRISWPELDFPLGISFFTLTQIMYLVDCYEGLLPVLSGFDHATFVSFFPYVISGPLANARRIVPQFGDFGASPGKRPELLSRGVYLFTLGLLKKVVFAFAFSRVADFGYSVSDDLSGLEVVIFSVSYTLQIYFDFSGYTDMAVGSALMLGIEIPRNFDAPLRSKSIIEFWQRWHITLSNFITNYLYTPILRSFPRATLATASIATLIAMSVAGLWHGPSWTFVVFGTLHGAALVINQYWRKKKMPKPPWAVSWFITFLLVDAAFVFFRSPDVHSAVRMISNVFSFHDSFGLHQLQAMHDAFSLKIFGVPLLLGTILAFWGKSSDQLVRDFAPSYRSAAGIAALATVSWLFMNSNISQQFVYFKF